MVGAEEVVRHGLMKRKVFIALLLELSHRTISSSPLEATITPREHTASSAFGIV